MTIGNKMKFRTKLTFLFLIIGLIPVTVLGYLNYREACKFLKSQAINQLISLREDRKVQIQDFFRDLRLNVKILSDHRLLKDILAKYAKAHEEGGTEGVAFKAVDAKYHGRYADLCHKYGYEDMLFVNNEGKILITARKEGDFGKDLKTGVYSGTNLAECFDRAKDGVAIVDFGPYPPGGAPAAFMGAPIISREERTGFKEGDTMGVLIIRIPVDQINAVTNRNEGLGETDEIYLMGRDLLMRSDSRSLKESFILKNGATGAPDVLDGKTGYREKTMDYRGHPVSLAYAPAEIEGLDWFVVAQKDLHEIENPLQSLKRQSFLMGLLVAVGVVFADLLFVAGIVRPLRRVRKATHRIASGDFDVRLPVLTKGEIGLLSDSINHMAINLKHSNQQVAEYRRSLEEKVTLRTEELNRKNRTLKKINHKNKAHYEILTALNADIEIEPLMENIIGNIVRHTDSQLGVIYLYEEETENLRPISTFAVDKTMLGGGFKLGHGLPGQAASKKQFIKVTDVPENYFRISSGGMEGMPKNIIFMPIPFKDRLMGVIELAGLHDYGNRAIEFLDAVAYQLGIGINNALAYLRLEEMARELREKSEFLAAQNEELQAQGEELQAQGEELQAQSEELISQKHSLEEKTEQVQVADRLKSEFMSNMSHELRTPLNVLLGLTNLMIEGNTGGINEKQKEYLEIIERNGKDLLQLINDVLDLSRIEAGKMEISSSEIKLMEFVKGIARAFTPLVEEKNLSLRINVPDDIVMYADADKLKQILVNLIGNAAKFTDKGEICIRAKVEVARIHDHVMIEVEDTGIGIPHEHLEHIFDPFRQVDGSSTRRHGGTGLGLNICRKLVGLMGGKIALKSVPEKGSTFTVTLKKDRRNKQRPSEEAWRKKVRAALLQKTGIPGKALNIDDKAPKNLLIVDDDPLVIRELKIIFKEENYRIEFAMTGSEGLDRIRSQIPDLVLLDLRMPGMDGFKFLKALQKDETTKNTPVMIITAADLNEAETRALGKNVKGIVTKGRIEQSVLLDKIHEILYGRRDRPEIHGQTAEEDEKKTARKGIVKILIAEDRPDNLVLTQESLRSGNYKIHSAKNGREAIETAEKERPDLILMDMQMPVMSGFEATKHIRNMEGLREVPIIALTARAMKGDEVKVLAAGCNDYLSKPIMPKDLIRKVEEWLAK